MTTEHQASRTLVKSPPELWAECSDAQSLVRHLGEFGEIKITALEPETTVAWEGEHASGTVEIEPSGWGTRVTLKVQTSANEVGPPEAELVAPYVTEKHEVHPVMEAYSVERSQPALEAHPVQEALPVQEPHPAQETRLVQEAADAKVEETSAEPDPAMAADPALTRRWKRVIDRTRTWFRSRSARMEVEEPVLEVEDTGPSESANLPATHVADPKPVERDAAEQQCDAATPVRDAVAPVPDAAAPLPGVATPLRDVATPLRDVATPLRDVATPVPDVVTPLPDAAGTLPEAITPSIDAEAVLSAALDSLGQAHHRPYSRA